jgi:hypothetical protein
MMVMTRRMLWLPLVFGSFIPMLSGCCSDDRVADRLAPISSQPPASYAHRHTSAAFPTGDPVSKTCDDGCTNGVESDRDCGGIACPGCADGQTCILDSDCLSGRCDEFRCGSCSDGLRTGSESDVDCGGPCGDCHDGQFCALASDCYSNRCEEGLCRSCYDGLQSGAEQDIDCGGLCAECITRKRPAVNSGPLLARSRVGL